MHTYTQAQVYTCKYMHMRVHTYTQAYVLIHRHAYTQTPSETLTLFSVNCPDRTFQHLSLETPSPVGGPMMQIRQT